MRAAKPPPKPPLTDRWFALEPRLIAGLLAVSAGLGLYLGLFLVQVALTGQAIDPLGDLFYLPR